MYRKTSDGSAINDHNHPSMIDDQLFQTCEPVRSERSPECDSMILEDAHPIHQTGRMLPVRRTDWKFESMGDCSIVHGTTIPARMGRTGLARGA
ncbi:MAG TPA: hypothetical protein PLU41_16810, partial [Acidobacteriota bacterium]|nr:hypothetical protein [Acidobacteriota bacterium]HQP75693.1 hypothetical protein [Acidobacteriota bacterium]